MAAAAAAAEGATELMSKLTLDTKTKTRDAPEITKKSAANQPLGRYLTTKPQQYKDWSNMYYSPNGYTPNPYYYGGYDGTSNAWNNYSRYMNSNGVEMSPNGIYGDMYHPGYAYAPYSAYASPGTVQSTGHTGQFYGAQHCQYPATYYHQQAHRSAPFISNKSPASRVSPSVTANQSRAAVDNTKTKPNCSANASGNVVPATPKPGQKNTSLLANGSQTSVTTGGRLANTGPMSLTSEKNQNLRPLHHLMAGTPKSWAVPSSSGIWNSYNSMYMNHQMNAQCGNAFGAGFGFGANFYGSRPNGCCGDVDSKYKPRGRWNGFNGYDKDGLGELNRGPRGGFSKNQKGSDSTGTVVDKEQSPSTTENSVPNEDSFNQGDLPEKYTDAKFFVIKSYSEDDVHKSIKYGVWASTTSGNKKLDAAYRESQKPGGCPVFLFFSVNASGQFIGVAEMVGSVDFNKTLEYWHQDKWTGCFPLKWHIVKDVPNNILRHIILENNDNKPVTNSRDTQEVNLELGLQMLKIFKEHTLKTSVLEDFAFYETRQKVMQERRAKQHQLSKPIAIRKPVTAVNEKDGAAAIEKPQIPTPSPLAPVPVPEKEAPQVCLSESGAI